MAKTTHQKVSPKLGVNDVDASGSRAQLIALEPLVSTFTFTFASFGKRKQIDSKYRLVLKISLTFGGGNRLLILGVLHPNQEDKDYHTG